MQRLAELSDALRLTTLISFVTDAVFSIPDMEPVQIETFKGTKVMLYTADSLQLGGKSAAA
jgi:hypothetical protein